MSQITGVIKDFTELPFRLPGHIYRSAMPFRGSDSNGEIYEQYRQNRVSVVVQLADDEECLAKTGFDLRSYYISQGLEVIYLPIRDFSFPAKNDLEEAIQEVIEKSSSGKNIAIHCYAGYGRTGLFAACLAKRIFGMDGEAAISWVRDYIPGALEMPGQIKMAIEF